MPLAKSSSRHMSPIWFAIDNPKEIEMNVQTLLLSLALLTACSSQNNGATSNASETAAAPPPAATLVAPVAAPTASDSMPAMAASASMPMADQSDSKTPSSVASATGVVKAVDPLAKTITLDHGPVEALHW